MTIKRRLWSIALGMHWTADHWLVVSINNLNSVFAVCFFWHTYYRKSEPYTNSYRRPIIIGCISTIYRSMPNLMRPKFVCFVISLHCFCILAPDNYWTNQGPGRNLALCGVCVCVILWSCTSCYIVCVPYFLIYCKLLFQPMPTHQPAVCYHMTATNWLAHAS